MRPLQTLKRAADVIQGLRMARTLGGHDRWTRDELRQYQHQALGKLVAHVRDRSPFYAKLYAGIDLTRGVDIAALPVVNKRMVLDNFDRVVTDRRLTLDGLRAHVGQVDDADDCYLGEYRVIATAGTSGLRGIFVYSRTEWTVVLANTLRWQRFIGVKPGLPHRTRIATVGADNPIHVSSRLPTSGDVGLFRIKQMSATEPLDAIVAALNTFQPDVLLPYPSIAALLAREQQAGRLAIAPGIISTHSEVLSADMAEVIEAAWGSRPFNHYGLTEEPHVAIECDQHCGMHVLEDTCIVEIVDEHNAPVPPGVRGSKCLLTNLYNRTLPLIRYDVSDMLTWSDRPCPCGRPFSLIESVAGRSEDLLRLRDDRGREILIPPPVLHMSLNAFPQVLEYQIRHDDTCIAVTAVAAPGTHAQSLCREIARRIERAVARHGAVPPRISVTFAEGIDRSSSRMGKAKRVSAVSGQTSPAAPDKR